MTLNELRTYLGDKYDKEVNFKIVVLSVLTIIAALFSYGLKYAEIKLGLSIISVALFVIAYITGVTSLFVYLFSVPWPVRMQRLNADLDAIRDRAKRELGQVREAHEQACRLAYNDFEDRLEDAYWDFDARLKGYSDYKNCAYGERDAFKAAVRAMRK